MVEASKDAAWLALMLQRARAASDEDQRFDLLGEATDAGSAAVRDAVVRLLASGEVEDQRLGADLAGRMPTATDEERAWAREVVGQLWEGERFEPDDRAAVAEALGAVLGRPAEPCVLESAIYAVGHQGLYELIPVVLAHATHAEADVREAVAWTLSSYDPDDPDEKIAALVALAHDPEDEVRSWALFALGHGGDERPIDTPAARAAYVANRDHPDEDVAGEARNALGLLGDAALLADTIESYFVVGHEHVEVARDRGDPRLHGPLLALREQGGAPDFLVLVDEAIAACAPAAAP